MSIACQERRARGVHVACRAGYCLVGETDGSEPENRCSPPSGLAAQCSATAANAAVHAGIARKRRTAPPCLAADAVRQWPNTFFESVALIGEGELGTLCCARGSDAPGDRPIVGHPHDQAALARHQRAPNVAFGQHERLGGSGGQVFAFWHARLPQTRSGERLWWHVRARPRQEGGCEPCPRRHDRRAIQEPFQCPTRPYRHQRPCTNSVITPVTTSDPFAPVRRNG